MPPQDKTTRCPNPVCERLINDDDPQDTTGIIECQACHARFIPPDTPAVAGQEPRMDLSMRWDIEDFIEHFNSSDEMPLASPHELAMMALCMKGPMTALEIFEWIHESFKWFRRMAYQNAWAQKDCARHGLRFGDGHFYPDLSERILSELHDLDWPFRKVTGDSLGIKFNTDKWTITPSSAMPFLDEMLRNSAGEEKTFRFMDLPAEIRVMVYEELLQFPPSGVLISPMGRLVRATALSKEFGAPLDLERWSTIDAHTSSVFRDYSLSRRLHIFLVSKQILKETMPVFFGINNFVFPHMEQMQHFLTLTPSHRLEHIQHISFNWPKRWLPTGKVMNECAKIMKKSMPRLSEIDMLVDEAGLMADTKNNGEPKYAEVTKIPLFRILQSLRGMKRVSFQGDCDTIRDLLVAEMTKPKKIANGKNSKKRKSKEASKNDHAGDGEGRRKTRKKVVSYKEEKTESEGESD